MKRETAFSALNSNRKAANNAAKAFAIRSINKDGSISKARVDDLCLARTQDEAEIVKARMEKMNPGRTFAITENN